MTAGTQPVDFSEFESRAEAIFAGIPSEYREGVDGLDVQRGTAFHPTLPEIYTLGECLSDFYPSEFGGAGDVRSRVVLYYGSFLALSRSRSDWDWEEELFETITHEVRHHLEHLALDDSLEVVDYVVDQNFARREGERFDPFFYRSGHPVGDDAYEVDGDLFVEVEVDPRRLGEDGAVEVEIGSIPLRVRVPRELADVHFLRVERPGAPEGAERLVVLVRRRGLGGWVRGVLGRAELEVREEDAEVLSEG